MALNELPQFVSIIALHVHELDAIAVRIAPESVYRNSLAESIGYVMDRRS